MNINQLMKYKQTLLMSLSLILSIGFFLPWYIMDPNFNMVAASDASFSGFSIVVGIKVAVEMANAFGTSYGFNMPSVVIYLGYLLLLIPILGVASIVLSGLRKPIAMQLHMIQYVFAVVVFTLMTVVTNISGEMRELIANVTNLGFGLVLSYVVAILGVVYVILIKKVKL